MSIIDTRDGIKFDFADDFNVFTSTGTLVPRTYDDGAGPLWIYRETLGVLGVIRADSWEDAFQFALDEIMDDADEADLEEYQKENGEGALPECHYYRDGTPDGAWAFTLVACADPNGHQVDLLTEDLASELGLTVEWRDNFGDVVDHRTKAIIESVAAFDDCDTDDVEIEEDDSEGRGPGRFQVRVSASPSDLLIVDDETATELAKEAIRDSAWAFNPDFLACYVPEGITADMIEKMRGDSCEDFNDAALALIEAGEGFDTFADDAIAADGRGHFLSHYDGEENEITIEWCGAEGGMFFAYRY